MYSLISAPVIGFDLTRLDGGAATADLLTALLAVPAADLAALARELPGDSPARAAARDRALHLAESRPSVHELAAEPPAAAIGLLRRAPVGSLAGLLHCVRTDVLIPDRDAPGSVLVFPPEPVVTMASDAICAAYLRELLSDHDRRTLGAAWLAVQRRLPVRRADLGPQHSTVRRLLGTIRTLPPAGRRALVGAADRMRAGNGDWAAAMHSATWAVHLSGRVRAAAAAQFLLVQAVDLAGVSLADRAGGVWNLLSGAVQAVVVRDLETTDSTHELLAPALSALGPGWLLAD